MIKFLIATIAVFVLVFWLHIALFAQGPIDRDLESLRSIIRYQLTTKGIATGLLTDATVDYAINRAIVQTCTKYPAIEKMDTVVVTNDSVGAGLNPDFDRIKGLIKFYGDTTEAMIYKPPDILPEVMGTKESGIEDLDKNETRYYYTNGLRLMVWPKPADGSPDTFLVEYYAIDAMLSASTDSTAIYQKYIEKVINYACVILSGTRRQYNDANFYFNLYRDEMVGDVKK